MTKADGSYIQFTDMFEIGTKTAEGDYDFTCASGFKATVVDGGAMCLKLKTGEIASRGPASTLPTLAQAPRGGRSEAARRARHLFQRSFHGAQALQQGCGSHRRRRTTAAAFTARRGQPTSISPLV